MSRDRFTASDYHLMTAAEKQAASNARMREQPVACPSCDTQVMPVDLLAHQERCEGPREPGPGSKWINHRDAIARGVPRGTLSRWVDKGLVRVRGGRGEREYLLRDVAKKIAQRRGFRRR